jgi:hypothetical protein
MSKTENKIDQYPNGRYFALGQKCQLCGVGPNWNNKPLKFYVEFLNKDVTDNKSSNLKFICPNCDGQLRQKRKDILIHLIEKSVEELEKMDEEDNM